MRRILYTLLVLLVASCANAQMVNNIPNYLYSGSLGVGRSTANDANAYLQVGPNGAGTKGMLIPWVADTAAITGTKRNFLLIRSSQLGNFAYWDSVGGKWQKLGIGAIDTTVLATRAMTQKKVDSLAAKVPTVDTTVLSTRAWRQKGLDSLATKIPTSDSSIYSTNGTIRSPRTVTLSSTNFLSFTGGDIYVNGIRAGRGNGNDAQNTIFGASAAPFMTGYSNTFVGSSAGYYTGSNIRNTFIGFESGKGSGSQTSAASRNTAIGSRSMYSLTTGDDNNAFGTDALKAMTTGVNNTVVGSYGLTVLTTGSYNTAIGTNAGAYYSNGSYNTFIGEQSGINSTGSSNVFLGYSSGSALDTNSNVLMIQNNGDNDALIRGNFLTDSLAINGKLTLRDAPSDSDSSARVPTTAWVKKNAGGGGGVGGSTSLSSLTAAGAANTIDNGNYKQEWQWNTLSSGTALKLSSTSTSASGIGGHKLLEVVMSGANATAGVYTRAATFTNSRTGTSSLNHALINKAENADQNVGVWNIGAYGTFNTGAENQAVGSTTGSINIGAQNSVSGGASGATNYGSYSVASGSTATTSYGAYGYSYATAGNSFGIYGKADGAATTNYGGYFTASGATNNYGLISQANGPSGIGVEARNVYAGASGIGYGLVASATGTKDLNIGGQFSASGATENIALYVSQGVTSLNGAVNLKIVTKTSEYTATTADHTILGNATSGELYIVLPSPSANGMSGRVYIIKKIDSSANAVIVYANGTIDGNSTYSLASQYKYVHVQSDGNSWFIIGNN